MSVEIQWTDVCPRTGEKRFVSAARFAREWRFKVRYRRREEWQLRVEVTRGMWEELLDAIARRLPRREGVTEWDSEYVRHKLEKFGPDPEPDGSP
jgi:hypothetical protein